MVPLYHLPRAPQGCAVLGRDGAGKLGRADVIASRTDLLFPSPPEPHDKPRSDAQKSGSYRVSVTLEVEGIDRMYLNVYVPQLQREQGVVNFLRYHRGQPFASSALLAPISEAFIRSIETFVDAQSIPMLTFTKDQRKDDVTAEFLSKFDQEEGVLYVGKAQEKTPVFRTEKRRNSETSKTYPWIVRSTAMINSTAEGNCSFTSSFVKL